MAPLSYRAHLEEDCRKAHEALVKAQDRLQAFLAWEEETSTNGRHVAREDESTSLISLAVALMRAKGSPFTRDDIANEARRLQSKELSRYVIKHAVRQLRELGELEVVQEGKGPLQSIYRVHARKGQARMNTASE